MGLDALPYVKLRFFRLPPPGTDDPSLLLAEGAADATGNYKVILPTR
jgi:hypothetical protein